MSSSALRPLSTGEILDVSFGIYRALFTPLLIVTMVTRGIPLILSGFVQSAGGAFVHPWLYLTALVLNIVLGALAAVASTFIISESYMGRRIPAQAALQRSMPFIGRLISLSILTWLLVVLGMFLLIVPGCILLAGLILATPAMVIEGIPHATDAMGRAWALSRGHRWKVFVCIMVTWILIALPVFATSGWAMTQIDPESPGGFSPGGVLWLSVGMVLQMLMYPMFYCVLTVAYYDLRIRKEGFDLEMLASGLAQA